VDAASARALIDRALAESKQEFGSFFLNAGSHGSTRTPQRVAALAERSLMSMACFRTIVHLYSRA
jgi:hypothetical protein